MNLFLAPLIGLGAPELLIILAIVVLVFGAAKLPELARGSGRALRIFKAETKGLKDSDSDQTNLRAEQVDDDIIDVDSPTPRDDTTR
ncbi:twin-arginine translocase TatA/TatE family subunit [Nocardioides gilvus]|uniref:twin-arginine translocase TatA/TatE family subunit n=1 Tax=Nocardioides gilvus TaxID=1735589 RepID=UPI000D74797A|nr:twin-arginine translocase TatA/TatE family subunit [Nocardioides gilvus]